MMPSIGTGKYVIITLCGVWYLTLLFSTTVFVMVNRYIMYEV